MRSWMAKHKNEDVALWDGVKAVEASEEHSKRRFRHAARFHGFCDSAAHRSMGELKTTAERPSYFVDPRAVVAKVEARVVRVGNFHAKHVDDRRLEVAQNFTSSFM